MKRITPNLQDIRRVHHRSSTKQQDYDYDYDYNTDPYGSALSKSKKSDLSSLLPKHKPSSSSATSSSLSSRVIKKDLGGISATSRRIKLAPRSLSPSPPPLQSSSYSSRSSYLRPALSPLGRHQSRTLSSTNQRNKSKSRSRSKSKSKTRVSKKTSPKVASSTALTSSKYSSKTKPRSKSRSVSRTRSKSRSSSTASVSNLKQKSKTKSKKVTDKLDPSQSTKTSSTKKSSKLDQTRSKSPATSTSTATATTRRASSQTKEKSSKSTKTKDSKQKDKKSELTSSSISKKKKNRSKSRSRTRSRSTSISRAYNEPSSSYYNTSGYYYNSGHHHHHGSSAAAYDPYYGHSYNQYNSRHSPRSRDHSSRSRSKSKTKSSRSRSRSRTRTRSRSRSPSLSATLGLSERDRDRDYNYRTKFGSAAYPYYGTKPRPRAGYKNAGDQGSDLSNDEQPTSSYYQHQSSGLGPPPHHRYPRPPYQSYPPGSMPPYPGSFRNQFYPSGPPQPGGPRHPFMGHPKFNKFNKSRFYQQQQMNGPGAPGDFAASQDFDAAAPGSGIQPGYHPHFAPHPAHARFNPNYKYFNNQFTFNNKMQQNKHLQQQQLQKTPVEGSDLALGQTGIETSQVNTSQEGANNLELLEEPKSPSTTDPDLAIAVGEITSAIAAASADGKELILNEEQKTTLQRHQQLIQEFQQKKLKHQQLLKIQQQQQLSQQQMSMLLSNKKFPNYRLLGRNIFEPNVKQKFFQKRIKTNTYYSRFIKQHPTTNLPLVFQKSVSLAEDKALMEESEMMLGQEKKSKSKSKKKKNKNKKKKSSVSSSSSSSSSSGSGSSDSGDDSDASSGSDAESTGSIKPGKKSKKIKKKSSGKKHDDVLEDGQIQIAEVNNSGSSSSSSSSSDSDSSSSSVAKRSKRSSKRSVKRTHNKNRFNNDAGNGHTDSDGSMLELKENLKPIGSYIKDRERMLNEMFRCIKGSKLRAMLPDILKTKQLREVKERCLDVLDCMSKKRIGCLLADKPMISSSGTEESSEDENDTSVNSDQSDQSVKKQAASKTKQKGQVSKFKPIGPDSFQNNSKQNLTVTEEQYESNEDSQTGQINKEEQSTVASSVPAAASSSASGIAAAGFKKFVKKSISIKIKGNDQIAGSSSPSTNDANQTMTLTSTTSQLTQLQKQQNAISNKLAKKQKTEVTTTTPITNQNEIETKNSIESTMIQQQQQVKTQSDFRSQYGLNQTLMQPQHQQMQAGGAGLLPTPNMPPNVHMHHPPPPHYLTNAPPPGFAYPPPTASGRMMAPPHVQINRMMAPQAQANQLLRPSHSGMMSHPHHYQQHMGPPPTGLIPHGSYHMQQAPPAGTYQSLPPSQGQHLMPNAVYQMNASNTGQTGTSLLGPVPAHLHPAVYSNHSQNRNYQQNYSNLVDEEDEDFLNQVVNVNDDAAYDLDDVTNFMHQNEDDLFLNENYDQDYGEYNLEDLDDLDAIMKDNHKSSSRRYPKKSKHHHHHKSSKKNNKKHKQKSGRRDEDEENDFDGDQEEVEQDLESIKKMLKNVLEMHINNLEEADMDLKAMLNGLLEQILSDDGSLTYEDCVNIHSTVKSLFETNEDDAEVEVEVEDEISEDEIKKKKTAKRRNKSSDDLKPSKKKRKYQKEDSYDDEQEHNQDELMMSKKKSNKPKRSLAEVEEVEAGEIDDVYDDKY